MKYPAEIENMFYFFNFYFYFILLYNTVLVLPYIIMTPPWVRSGVGTMGVFPILNTPSHLPAYTIPLGHPSASAPSILYLASNLDW